MTQPFIWAHRGASSCAPENTLSAFSAAVAAGADGLELDIHLSCDGIPVVIHDETLERTTGGCGFVAEMTAQQLRQLDAGSWFSADFADESIPLLDDVLRTFGGQLRLNLELKELRAGMVVLKLLKQYPSADIVVSSFNCELLQHLRSVNADLPIAVLFELGNWRHAVKVARELSACAFHPALNQVNDAMLAACTEAALPVLVWTVDDLCTARSLIGMGVSGFFTNDPAKLKAAFQSDVSSM
ncbi:MAG: hypothetical protein KAU27_04030 [Desulfuromonadales bacterium]|nr:hypothetical protein [Desulfuromonadales bacterium]